MKKLLAIIAGVAFVLGLLSSYSFANVYEVSNTNDSGSGSLRLAITSANSAPGPHTINFNLPSADGGYTEEAGMAYWRITPSSALPELTRDNITISGESQTATVHGDSNPYGPEVVIDGSSLGGGIDGLSIGANNCVIKNIVINNFSSAGIYIGSSNSNEVYGCYLGTDASAEVAAANDYGIQISQGSYNIIGSSESSKKNILSGNTTVGININGANASGNKIRGNYIGTNRTATSALANSSGGISFQGSTSQNTIGGTIANELNIISGNGGVGINIDASNTNEVVANYIGTDINGTSAITNESNGILITGASFDNNIGDGTTNGINIISGNLLDGVNIADSNTSNNKIRGNYIGTDVNGTTALPNIQAGVRFDNGASLNTVGGSGAEKNIISGNSQDGVVINSSANNIIQGNYIGIDVNGTADLGNTWKGVRIYGDGSNYNTVESNVISGNQEDGVNIGDSFDDGSLPSSNEVLGNYIGLSYDGLSAITNESHGISLPKGAQYNKIGNGTNAGRNIISGNGGSGIYIAGTNTGTNEIIGNYIGTDVNGTSSSSVGNGTGISVNSCSIVNYIGGTGTNDANVISGNDGSGIDFSGGDNFYILQNIIGLDKDGTAAAENTGVGISLDSSSTSNYIGNGGSTGRNIISSNTGAGIYIGGSWNTIDGNYIGTGINGTIGLGNGQEGIYLIDGSSSNTISDNIISGNINEGIKIRDNSTSNEVTGNTIGLNAAGSGALGNGSHGVNIQEGGDYNIIGGAGADDGNCISSNSGCGIIIDGQGIVSTDNQILGNYIGLATDGTTKRANTSYGIELAGSVQNTQIGDGSAGGRNYIAGNGSDGITISGSDTNTNEVNNNYIGADTNGDNLSNAGAAINYTSGDSLIDNDILNCYIFSSSESGSAAIKITDFTDFSIQGNTIESYFDGIKITNNNDNFVIAGNVIIGHDNQSGMVVGDLSEPASTGLIATNEVRSFQTNLNIVINAGETLTIDRNTIVKFSENGFYIPGGSPASTINITNSIFSQDPDQATSTTGIGLSDDGSSASINTSYCNVYGNLTNYNNITSGIGTISAVAQFVDTSNNNYNLSSNSPCVDVGTPEGVDMGAYPYDRSPGQPPAVNLTSPNGGEDWEIGTNHNITWHATSESGIDNIYLSYSIDGGSSYTAITTESNTGSYSWTIPSVPTDEALVRVSAEAGALTSQDTSNSTFTISTTTTPEASLTLKDTTSGNTSYTNTKVASVEITTITGTPTEMLISEEASFAGASWQSFSANSEFSMTSNNGTKEVFLKVRNATLDTSNTTSETIIFDNTAPSVPSLEAPTDGSSTSNDKPPFSWEASTDSISGLASYEVNFFWPGGSQTVYTTEAIHIPAGAGPDNLYTWEVRASDNAGNWSSYSTSWEVTIDTSTPTVDSISLKDTSSGSSVYTNSQTISLEATLSSGVPTQMIISEEASFSNASWQTYSATTEFTLSATNGTKEVYYKVRLYDLTESATVSASIILDTVAPSVPTLEAPADGATTSNNNPPFTWETSADQTSGVASYELNLAWPGGSGSTYTSETTYQSATPTTDNIYTWEVRTSDNAGNWSSYSSSFTFTINTSTPAVSSIALKDTSTANTSYTNNQTISVEASGVSGSPTQMIISQEADFAGASWTTYEADFEYSITSGDGTKTVYYKVRNAALTESSTVSANIVLDTVAPSVPTLESPGDGSTISNNQPTFSWEASADETSGVANYEIILSWPGGSNTDYTSEAVYDPGGPGADNPYTWEVRASDNAGNWSSYSTSFTFTVNTSTPAVSALSLKDTSTGSTSYTNNQTISVEASGVSGSPTQMIISQEADFAGASWTTYEADFEYSTTSGDGTKTVYYKVRNSALTESSTVSASITLDTTAPSVPTLESPSNGAIITDSTPTFSWEASADAGSGIASYQVRVDGSSTQTTTESTINWPSALTSASHTWDARALDNAGNYSSYSSAWSFIVATSTPTVDSISLKDTSTGSSTYTNSQTISVEASNVTGSPTQMIVSEEASFSNASWQSYSATFEYTTSSGDGSKTVYYKVRNSVLTESSTVSASITLDTSAPTVTLYQPDGGETLTGGTSYAITWEATDAISSQAAISINLRYSTNAGSSWTSIASGQSNDGSYSWTVPYVNSSQCRVSIEAIDQVSNLGFDSSASNFTITTESDAPTISIKVSDGTIKNGDYIPALPTFVAVITDTSSVDTSAITMTLDGSSVSPTVSIVSSITVEAEYTVSSALANESIMTHAITVEASDIIGNTATEEVSGLKVSRSSARIVGNVLTYPTKFNPAIDQTCTISYTLSADTNISIYIISPAGTIEWTKKIVSGDEGGKAGYNEVSFNGVSDLFGSYLSNGIYPIKIIANNRVIGTGYIVIFM